MTPERWQRLSSIYHAANACPTEERVALLRDLCAGDDVLRQEVADLLAEGAIDEGHLSRLPLDGLLTSAGAGTEPPLTDQQLGAYTVKDLLGKGGMGEVYRAHDTQLGRDVALKILPPAFTTDPDRLARFEREARILASLSHPNIAAIYGLERRDSVHALVLELVEGSTLAERITSGGMTVSEALETARQIADALDAAHQRGIVHRDLKPANVKLTPVGMVKVLDFGLAKTIVAADAAATRPEITAGHTRAGTLLGTVPYMSPEQARGQAVDKRTDIWAFGCVLYEMLTGRPAFTGASGADVLAAVVEKAPDWSALPASIPPAVTRLLQRCLDKDVRRRLRDIGEASLVLEDALSPATSHGASRSDSRTGIRSRWPAWSMAATAVLALGVAVAVLRRPADSAPAASTASVARIASIAVLPIQNLSGDRDLEFVGDGTTEELISSLSQLRPLRVVSRTSVMSYKTSTKSAATVARELGVDAVLEGAVRGSRDRLRITTQVVNAADDSTLWSKSYEASSADLLAVQENIARSVAAVVFPGDPPQASAHVRSRGTTPAAYTEILQGHALRRVGDFGADAQRALEHYRKAVALDPKSALAHASLALGLERLAGSTGIDEARAAAERALALDPELSESHAAMAWVHYRNHDWEEGHRESRRAMALNPSSFDACTCFAIIMAWTGRDTEALAVADEVIARNPRGAAAYANRAMVLYFGRRYGGALASARQALALDPAIFLPKVVGPMALGWLGRADEGVAQLASSGPQKTHVMAMLLGRAGRHGEARQLMQEVASATPPVDSVFMAFGYGWLGDKERTISWLTRSVESRESRAAQVIDETFDFVRADPRFEALVRKMKMPSSYYEFLRSKGAPASSSLP